MALISTSGLGQVPSQSWATPAVTPASPGRTTAGWCSWWVVGGIAEKLGVEACQPLTQDELNAMTQYQATGACQFDADPAACEARLIAAAASAQAAAEATDPTGTCEYNASQQHPTLSNMLGTAAVCNLYAGAYTPYLLVAAALVIGLIVFQKRSGR